MKRMYVLVITLSAICVGIISAQQPAPPPLSPAQREKPAEGPKPIPYDQEFANLRVRLQVLSVEVGELEAQLTAIRKRRDDLGAQYDAKLAAMKVPNGWRINTEKKQFEPPPAPPSTEVKKPEEKQ